MLARLLAHRYLLGVVSTLLVVAALGAGIGAWLLLGGFDVAASKPHAKLVAWAAHTTMINSVKHRAKGVRAPDAFNQDQVMAGALAYEEHCLACHGGAAVARAPWASALLPAPPYLVDAARHWSKQDLYVVLQDGVKMSAMPAWGEILSQQEIWDLVAFLEAMPDLSPDAYAAMRTQIRSAPTTPLGASGPNAALSPQPLQETTPLSRTVRSGDAAGP